MTGPVALMRIEVMDLKTCAVCRELHGLTVPVGSPQQHLVEMLAHPHCRREVVEIWPGDVPEEYQALLTITPPDVVNALGRLLTFGELARQLEPRGPREVASNLLGFDSREFVDFLLDLAYRGEIPHDPWLAELVRAIREALGL